MPDQDVIDRALPHRWRKASRLARGGADAPTVALAVNRALAATLRASGGCPGLAELSRGIVACAEASASGSWVPRWDEIGRRAGSHKNTRIAHQVGHALLGSGDVASTTPGNAAEKLALGLASRLVDHYLFSRIRPELVRTRFGNLAAEGEFETDCLEQLPLNKLASQLVTHPDGNGIRAPARRMRRPGTKVLLQQPV
jgi:hypothetical protein